MSTPDAEKMRSLLKQGKAMPTPADDPRPGRFPIANRDGLIKAIRAVGRVQPPTEEARAKVRRFIIARAKTLNMADAIPDNWAADGSLKS